MDKLLLTPEEAAGAVGISRTTMYQLITRGLVESVQIGRCRRVPAAALADYVERLRSGSRGEVVWP